MAAHTVSETASILSKRTRSTSDASSLLDEQSMNQKLTETQTIPLIMNSATFQPPMKRRVNPDSLASRLEPDLVRDMNALIIPGNYEMPSFAVRKELQERYNIDRRHIYDYFHSKGLRVIKDDKVSNLVRRTDRPTKIPQVTVRPIRQVQPRKYHSLDGITRDVPVPQVKSNKSIAADRVKRQAKHRSQSVLKGGTQVVSGFSALTAELQQAFYLKDSNANNDLSFFANPLHDDFTFTRVFSDVSDTYLARDSSNQMDFYRAPAPILDVSNICLTHILETSPILPLDRPFSQEERMAMYNSLDAILGPACGIQESVGTYRKYMEERSRLYYDRLHRNSHMTLGTSSHGPCASLPCRSDDKNARGSEDEVDFRKWLSGGQIFGTSGQSHPNGWLRITSSESSTRQEMDDNSSSWPCNVTRDSAVFYSSCYDKTGDAMMGDLVPELTPIDILHHLLDPFDPVVRSTVPCPVLARKDQDMPSQRDAITMFGLSATVLSTNDDEDNDGTHVLLSPAHPVPCDSWSRHARFDHERDRSTRMKPIATVVPIGSEVAKSEECFQWASSPPLDSIHKTAAIRNPRTARKRSSSAVSARLRTTSAGGGM